MIDTEGVPNWRRWEAKEQRGVNRGYEQAYINENRADHYVLISTREFEYHDEYKVTVKFSTDDTQRFEGTPSDADALLADAESAARDWMCDHPCDREGSERDAVELLTDLLNALRDEDLVPQHDADMTGWTGARGSTGFSLRPLVEAADGYETTDDPREADALYVNLGVDGKESGLRYREYTECDSDGETRRMHEPRNPEKLVPKVERAFEAAGLDPEFVRKTGHQCHWDYKTSYSGRAAVPDDLTLPKPQRNRRRRRVF